jgi:uncharacterized protein (TIGR03067 family)
MKRYTFLTLAVVFMLAADDSKDARSDAKMIEGAWTVESIEVDGQKTPDDEIKKFKLTIDGDKYALTNEVGVISKGKLKLDSSKKPKTMDITPSEGDNSGQEMAGIYELDGMKLKVCYCRPGGDRPNKFSADSGSGQTMVKATKAKPEKKEAKEKK